MTPPAGQGDTAALFRQRARQAEAQACLAADDASRDVLHMVAFTWRQLALEAGRQAAGPLLRPEMGRATGFGAACGGRGGPK